MLEATNAIILGLIIIGVFIWLVSNIGNDRRQLKTRVIIITGRSAAGKTTLGENFNTLTDYIHFDADQYAYGKHPTKDAGKTIQKRDQLNRSKELVDVYDNLAVKHGYYALFQDKKPDLSVWTPFYTLLAKEINKTRVEYEHKNIVVTQSVYTREVRDYVRSLFGEELIFIVLNISTELLPERMVVRAHERAAEIGQTADEYLKSYGTSIEKIRTETAALYQKGFEVMQPNEPNTFQIDVNGNMTKTDVFNVAKKLLRI